MMEMYSQHTHIIIYRQPVESNDNKVCCKILYWIMLIWFIIISLGAIANASKCTHNYNNYNKKHIGEIKAGLWAFIGFFLFKLYEDYHEWEKNYSFMDNVVKYMINIAVGLLFPALLISANIC